MCSKSNDSWFVAQLKPHGLKTATVNLKRQGLRPFAPKMRCTKRNAQRIIETETPVFPGYIFIQSHNMNAHHLRVNNTRGISRLIAMSSGRPSVLSTSFVEALLERCNDQDVLEFAEDLPVGSIVEIVSGPFAQQVGEIQNLGPNGRIKIMMDVLGKETIVTLNRAAVRQSGHQEQQL